MRKQREETFEKYEKVAKELQEKEDLLHASMRPDRENIVSEKRFFLMDRMAKEAGIECTSLLDMLVDGVHLTGRAKDSGLFVPREQEPILSKEQVMKSSRWTRQFLKAKGAGNNDAEIDKEVWEITKWRGAEWLAERPIFA